MLCCYWRNDAAGLEEKMPRLLFARLLATLLLLALSGAACAPPVGMSATLTMLPGTFTPLPPTRAPTRTPDLSATPTLTQTPTPTGAIPSATPRSAGSAPACPLPTPDPGQPLPSTPAGFVGQHYDPNALPNGLTWVASGTLMSANYSYAHVRWQGKDLFWIQKLACQNPSGHEDWEITSALALPALNAQAHQVISNACFRGSTQVPFAIAYGTYDPSQPAALVANRLTGWKLQVTAAWQMTDQFKALDPQGLVCVVQQP